MPDLKVIKCHKCNKTVAKIAVGSLLKKGVKMFCSECAPGSDVDYLSSILGMGNLTK